VPDSLRSYRKRTKNSAGGSLSERSEATAEDPYAAHGSRDRVDQESAIKSAYHFEGLGYEVAAIGNGPRAADVLGYACMAEAGGHVDAFAEDTNTQLPSESLPAEYVSRNPDD